MVTIHELAYRFLAIGAAFGWMIGVLCGACSGVVLDRRKKAFNAGYKAGYSDGLLAGLRISGRVAGGERYKSNERTR